MTWRLIDGFIILLLVSVSGVWLLWHHAYGAYGDDAPGYIYTAHQLITGQPLVAQDPLVQDALAWFGAEPYARFVAPAHHEIISPAGWTVSRYPIGLSVLMAGAAWLFNDPLAIYLIVPLTAIGVVLLTYLGAIWLLPVSPVWQRVTGLGAAVIVLGTNLFFTYSVAQPMREIPALFFFMIGALLFVKTKRWYLLLVAGIFFGYSVAIRETNIILLLPLVFYSRRWRTWLWFALGAFLIYLPFLWQAAIITQHKEVFREKDITNIAITSNIDHIQSFAVSNLWNNQGKFKPGVGGLNQYWSVLKQFSTWPLFFLTILVGAGYLWKKQRPSFWLLGSWVASIVLLFALWINPYPRYILPILPVLAWLSMVGVMAGWEWFSNVLRLKKVVSVGLLLLVLVSFIAAYQPVLASRQDYVRTGTPQDRELTKADLLTIQQAIALVQNAAVTTDKTPLVLLLGETKGGLAETIMTHTTIQTIRFPNKDKEQPPFEQFQGYIDHLSETYTIYVWYDQSVTADEQRFFNQSNLSLVTTLVTSFKPEISIYAYSAEN